MAKFRKFLSVPPSQPSSLVDTLTMTLHESRPSEKESLGTGIKIHTYRKFCAYLSSMLLSLCVSIKYDMISQLPQSRNTFGNPAVSLSSTLRQATLSAAAAPPLHGEGTMAAERQTS